MSLDSCNDYYQLCYNSDTSPGKDDEYKRLVNGDFPYEQYISSPKSLHNKHFYNNTSDVYTDADNIFTDEPCPLSPGSAIYSDLNTMKHMLQSSYMSEKLCKNNDTEKGEDYDKQFVEEAVSCLESLLVNGDEETYCNSNPLEKPIETSKDLSKPGNSHLPGNTNSNGGSSDIIYEGGRIYNDGDEDKTGNYTALDSSSAVSADSLNTNELGMYEDRYFQDEDSSSSGVSSYSHSSTSSFTLSNSHSLLLKASSQSYDPNMLDIEISKLKNIRIKHSPESYKRHSLPKVVNDVISENMLLEEKSKSMTSNVNTRSSTPNGRKSPFFDIFKSKRSLDSESSNHGKFKINKKMNKSVLCATRSSNSAFFCNFKKANLKAVNLMEKHAAENRMEGDVNDEMKIQHASPFVRTIFQYVESSSVEDIFSTSNFSINDSNNVPVFTCGGMRTIQDNKFNSLSRKSKKNGIIRTMERGQHEPALVSSGRRISENSDFYISIIAYLDRIRKAKVVSLRRRPRHRRHKSDPGDSISMFFSENETETAELRHKHRNSSSDQLAEAGLLNLLTNNHECEKPWTLSKRFSDLQGNSDNKNFKSYFSSSDSALNHRFSLCEDTNDHKKSISRKSRSLKNISSYASKKKCFLMNEVSKRDSFDANKLLNADESSSDSKEFIHHGENKEMDNQPDKFQHARRELFPNTEKNLAPRRSACFENNENKKIFPPRRSVFSENFDISWPPSLATSTPNEIKCWLDSQELGPEDRQTLTEQLLLQLTQMGPSCSRNSYANQSEHKSSTDNLISSSGSINDDGGDLHGNNDITKEHSFTNREEHVNNIESNDQLGEHNKNTYKKGKEIDELKGNSFSNFNERNSERLKSKKLFGSMRRNKSKSVDWNRMHYSNDAYDGDSIKRKPKHSSAKLHDNQKVKRFSAIRSIFEPITSPKSKKGLKSPTIGKFDRFKLHNYHQSKSSDYSNSINKIHTNDSGVNNDGLKNEESRAATGEVHVVNDRNRESPTQIDMSGGEKVESKENIHTESTQNILQDNFMFSSENKDNCNPCIRVDKETCSTCEKKQVRNLYRKSRSIDSISDEIKFNRLHRRPLSRSVDAIHELKRNNSFSAALFQDINDSGILDGYSSNENPVKCNSPKDVIEVYISNGFVNGSENCEKENVVDEVASSEPNLNRISKDNCLHSGCDQCHVSNKDVENSRIVVDIPHHLIPPEIASKSPIQSPNIQRKGVLKKTPCLLQHSLSHGERGEKGIDFTSADSGLSLSGEIDHTQPQHDKDITNFCLVNETNHPVILDLNSTISSNEASLPSKINQSNHSGRQNSIHKTEIIHHIDRVSFENKSLPQIISFSKDHLPESISCKNERQESNITHKVISPIVPKFKENIFSSDNVNTNTVQCPSQVHSCYSISNQKKDSNKVELKFKTPPNTISVARVQPFNKSASHESPDETQLHDEKESHIDENNSGEMHLTRKPSVIWAIVKKMEVSLVIQKDYGDPDVIKIEDFNVRRVNKYKDVEELVIDTYMKHLQLLDKQHLDLDTYDIKHLQMADHKIPIGSAFDLSTVKIEDAFLPCKLCMKDKESWSLASLSYDSLIPKSYLEKYVSLILSHYHAIFFGPSGTGKSYLAERIANLINYRVNEDSIPPIILKNATPERWRTLLTNLRAEKREKPFVIILDGFSQRFIDSDIDIYDIVKVCEEKDPKPYVICTMTVTPNIQIPPKWQLNFRWIWLSNHEEPIDGILQRYLRRKFIQFGNQHLQRESFRIADWLTSVWRHINTFLNKFTSTDCSLGPTMFYDCPSDILEAEEWFVDLWNYSITPYILHSVKQGLKMHGVRCEWEDPLSYILKSYPWVSEKVKRKMKLKRICMEDVDFSLHRHSEEEKQRLLDFLRQLEVMMFENIDQGNHPTSKGYRNESSL